MLADSSSNVQCLDYACLNRKCISFEKVSIFTYFLKFSEVKTYAFCILQVLEVQDFFCTAKAINSTMQCKPVMGVYFQLKKQTARFKKS